jgi:branched-chain amino acid transport system ATP-binding protein
MSNLRLHDLESGYGDVTVIQGISLEVEHGQLVSLVGSNGAGKTTLLRTIAGLIKADKGQVTLGEKNLEKLWPHEVVEAGFMMAPEGKQLFLQMSVEENLIVGSFNSRASGRREKTLKEIYELFPRLSERKNQVAGSLSGGEQQMLAVGRALMGRPSILALDEPSLGLAPIIVEQLFQVIDTIRQTGLTILLIEQNVQQALEMADFGYVLENGKIAMQGSGKELLGDENLQKTYMGI